MAALRLCILSVCILTTSSCSFFFDSNNFDGKLVGRPVARELLEGFRKRRDEKASIRSKGQILAQRSIGSEYVKYSLLYLKPDMVKLRLLASDFNQPYLLVTSNKEQITAIAYAEKQYAIGENSTETMNALLHIPLSAEQFSDWFIGILPSTKSDTTQVRKKDNSYLIKTEIDHNSYLIASVEAERSQRVKSVDLYRDDKLLFHSDFIYPENSSSLLPRSIEVDNKQDDYRATIVIERLQVNPKLSSSLFAPPSSKGLELIILSR